MAHLIGQDFTPPDIRAKVTGRAKYAEDFRADGMLFCRLLTSPMPHARVLSVDASEALDMDGVVAILTADEVPEVDAPGNTSLTNEPLYVGAPPRGSDSGSPSGDPRPPSPGPACKSRTAGPIRP